MTSSTAASSYISIPVNSASHAALTTYSSSNYDDFYNPSPNTDSPAIVGRAGSSSSISTRSTTSSVSQMDSPLSDDSPGFFPSDSPEDTMIDTPRMTHRLHIPHRDPSSSSLLSSGPAHVSPPQLSPSQPSLTSDTDTAARKPFKWTKRRIAAYAVGHIANDMFAACWFTYLLVLLTKVRNLSSFDSGLVLLAGQLADAAATPFVGLFSDKTQYEFKLGRVTFGRRKVWYLWGSVITFINYFLVFGECVLCWFVDDPSDGEILTYYVIAASLFNVGWAAVQVSHMALVPELSKNTTIQLGLNGARYSATVGANILVFLILLVLVQGMALDDQAQFTMLSYNAMVIGLFFTIWFLLGTSEKLRTKSTKNPRGEVLAKSVKRIMKQVVVKDGEENSLSLSSSLVANGVVSDSEILVPREKKKESILDSLNSSKTPPPPESVDPASSNAQSESNFDPKPIHRSKSETSVEEFLAAEEKRMAAMEEPLLSSSNSDNLIAKSSVSPDSPSDTGKKKKKSSLSAKKKKKVSKVAHFTWKDWFFMRDFYVVGFIYMCTRMVVNVSQTFLPFFILDTLNLSQIWITILPAFLYVASFVSAIYMKKINNYLGKKRVFTIGTVLTVVSLGVIWVMPADSSALSLALLFVATLLLGVGQSTTMVVSVQLEADLVEKNYKSNAFVYGFLSFTDKLANGIGIFLLQMFNDESAEYVRIAETALPCLAALAAFAALWFVTVDKEGKKEKKAKGGKKKRGKHSKKSKKSSRATSVGDTTPSAGPALPAITVTPVEKHPMDDDEEDEEVGRATGYASGAGRVGVSASASQRRQQSQLSPSRQNVSSKRLLDELKSNYEREKEDREKKEYEYDNLASSPVSNPSSRASVATSRITVTLETPLLN